MKGIKREFIVPRTPQQNGIAERKNRTFIEAARTMLADSLLPIPFWAEAINTTCYVQNRVLVTKPHNRTPYKLLLGRTPSIGFMRPFGCLVTILNTLDSLGKFDGKVDEGFLVGYSVSSKAFRVFNSRTCNHSNPSAGFQEKFNAEKAREEIKQQYVLFPVWSFSSINPHNTDGDDAFDEKKPESEVNVSPSSSAQSKKHDDKTKREDKGKSVESFIEYRDLSAEFEVLSNNSINEVNAAGTLVPTIGQISPNSTNTFSAAGPSNAAASPTHGKSSCIDASQLPDDPEMPKFEDITYSDDEDDVGAEADFNNLETSITVSPIPTTRVHKDHHVTQIIGDLSSATQTKSRTRVAKYQSRLSQMFNDDFHTCMFVCFLSQEEPLRVHQALKDPSWIEAMKEELLQFKMQKVWVLVDLPYGKRAIGTKWVFRNKKDERGIVVRNKARLIVQGHTHEEGINYEEVFAPVARIEAIRLFLAYASFMGFMVYKWMLRVLSYMEILRKRQKGDILLVQIYVDDIIFGSTNKDLCKSFEKLMKDKFQMSSIGKLTFFLGLQELTHLDVTRIGLNIMELMVFLLPSDEKVGVECMSVKRTSWNEFSSSMASAVIYLSSGRKFNFSTKQVGDLSTHTTKYTSPALTQKVFANMRRVGKGFFRVETPLFKGMLVAQEVGEGVADAVHDEGVPATVPTVDEEPSIPSPTPPTPPPQPSQDIPSTSQDTGILMNLLQEVMDTYVDVVLEAKEVVVDAKANQDAKEDESELTEVQEVVDVVTTAKLITEVVTTASTTITAAEVLVPTATNAAASALTVAPSRRSKGVVIRDLEESTTTTTSTIMHTEAKSKDKGKGILVEDLKPLKKQAQIKQDEQYARELEAELNRNIDWDEVMNHLKKKAKEDPAVKRTKEQIDEEESRALKRINETPAEKAAKRQKLDEEVEELKRHLQIVPNEENDVYTEATSLARKVPVVDYEIINQTNKPYYKIIRAYAKVKSWKLLESCGVQIIAFTTTQLILLVERKYPLTRFTLDQMLNVVRLEVKEESEVSLELLRFIQQQHQEGAQLESWLNISSMKLKIKTWIKLVEQRWKFDV
nr:hypothetical protein [Tanacetum cinerariifolium]